MPRGRWGLLGRRVRVAEEARHVLAIVVQVEEMLGGGDGGVGVGIVPPAGQLAKAATAVFADQRRLRGAQMHRDQAATGVVGEVAAFGVGGCADDVHDLGRLVAVRVVGVGGYELGRGGLVGE